MNINIIQRLQSKILQATADALWFVSNLTLHMDFKMSLVEDDRQEKNAYSLK
jgi:hypothetical protein